MQFFWYANLHRELVDHDDFKDGSAFANLSCVVDQKVWILTELDLILNYHSVFQPPISNELYIKIHFIYFTGQNLAKIDSAVF